MNKTNKDADAPNYEKDNKEPAFYYLNGKEYCDEEVAVLELLQNGILFIGSDDKNEFTTICVNSSDLFFWGCADGENLPYGQIGTLYKIWEKDKKWGAAKWCCMRRNEKPQAAAVKLMKEDSSWDDDMEKLPENRYEKICKEQFIKKNLERNNE